MRVASYSVVHYGKSYLDYAISSVYDTVDQCYIFYTSHPSHGHNSKLPPIETRDGILNSISKKHYPKLVWIDVDEFWDEGPQRDYAVKTLIDKKNDLIVVLDYDEIWPDGMLQKCLNHVWQENKARNWLVNMLHFYRSFNYVCSDNMWPVRIIDTRHSDGTAYISNSELGKVYHFGYAIKDEILEYKIRCHGHHDEWKKEWLKDKWYGYQAGITNDVHPTCNDTWYPEPFDKSQLPDFMKSHPYYDLEIV